MDFAIKKTKVLMYVYNEDVPQNNRIVIKEQRFGYSYSKEVVNQKALLSSALLKRKKPERW